MLIDVTPGSRQKAHEPWTLEKLYHKRCLALGSAIDTATLGPYNSALNSYITFCQNTSFPCPTDCRHHELLHCFHVITYQTRVCLFLPFWDLQSAGKLFFLMFVRLGTPRS